MIDTHGWRIGDEFEISYLESPGSQHPTDAHRKVGERGHVVTLRKYGVNTSLITPSTGAPWFAYFKEIRKIRAYPLHEDEGG